MVARRTTPRRVLFAYRGDVDRRGGAAAVAERTADALKALGVETSITHELAPDPSGFDVVHAINVWSPDTALEQLRNLRAAEATIVWQPFYLGYRELAWALRAVPAAVGRPDPEEREEFVRALATGQLEVGGMRRFADNEIVPGFRAMAAEMLSLVDHVVVCSSREAQLISHEISLDGVPFAHTPHGVDADRYAAADPQLFRDHLGLGDDPFILCVAALDGRKNQALLAHALRDHELPLVLVGPSFEPAYRELVLGAGGPNVRHVDRIPADLVASALAGAAVHALPSWAEGAALASIEAAVAGCPVVVGDRSSEFEYLGPEAWYCDPASAASIRAAVDAAIRAREREPERLGRLAARMRELTWERTARASLTAYEAALAAPRSVRKQAAEAAQPRVSDQLRHFTDALPWVRRPILDFVREIAESLPRGTRVFDVGAGEAPYRELFEHCRYVTNDWTHSVHPGARAADVLGPAHDLAVDDECFDVVLLTEVLEHTPNPDEVLAELHRVLRPGGTLHMTVPFAWELHELPFDFYRYTPWALDRLLRGAGFAAVDIRPRNDSFATLAQLMADMSTKVGFYPDGRDDDRRGLLAQLQDVSRALADGGPLDVRRSMPLGYRVSAFKAPLPERERDRDIPDTRGFVVLGHGHELLFDPGMLAAYGAHFSADDDATLVIHAPGAKPRELEDRVRHLVAAAGVDGPDAPDMLLLHDAPEGEAGLARAVDAVLSLNPAQGELRFVPHFHRGTLPGLRAAAERAWDAALQPIR